MPEAVARLERVTRQFGGVEAVASLDLEVRRGELLALLGPNGAGKTTTVRLLLGLTRPDAGRVTVLGRPAGHRASRARTGAMLQLGQVPEVLTVRELVELLAAAYPAPLPVAQVLAEAGLEALASRRAGLLSGGERQRLLYGLAICGSPDLLFLDEPTVGLDVEARRGFWAAIRRRVAAGCTVVLTTHYIEEADALADRVVVLDHGRVRADGTPAAIKASVTLATIRCVSALDDLALRHLPAVAELRRRGETCELLSRRPEQTLRALLALDPGLSGLTVGASSLEDAFLALTRGEEEVAA